VFRRFAVLAFCALVLPVSTAQAWTWPVDGPVLRPFSFDRAHPYTAGQHRGIDLGASAGSDVRAPAPGVVSFAGTVPTGGKTLSIETPAGYTATLVHLGSFSVKRGDRVDEGAIVGTVGPSGVAELTEPYVYYGLRATSDPQGYVDPLPFLPAHAAETLAVQQVAAAPPTVQSDAPVAAAPE
jgi:murein DD-endopeptidase MepM/ murein hydrolase activator NlpD